MKRVLVPLDGTRLAESILPDARRLAGPEGTLILIRDVYELRYEQETGQYTVRSAVRAAGD